MAHEARTHWLLTLAVLAAGSSGCSQDRTTGAQQVAPQPGAAGVAAPAPAPAGAGAGAGAGATGQDATPPAAPQPRASGAPAPKAGAPSQPSDPPPSAASDAAPPSSSTDAMPQPQADAGVDAAAPSSGVWQWPTGEPEAFGLERATLDQAADAIQRSTGNRYGIVVVRKGTLIYEKYWQGGADDKHVIYSCTKSWGSSLIGIAVTKGLLTVQDEVRKWVPEPAQGVSRGATLEHVLTQSAHTNPPGQSFQYNSGYLLNTAPEVLGAAAGVTPHAFYQENLVKPLGLSMTWPPCPAGGCAGTRYKEGFIQFGNQPPEAPNKDLPESTVRDQAKLGWLWANQGKWEGKQLISPEYIAAGSKPGAGFRADYGYLIWIENEDQFSAIGGVGNCYVHVMPSKQLVIAVMGGDAGLGQGGAWTSFQSLARAIRD